MYFIFIVIVIFGNCILFNLMRICKTLEEIKEQQKVIK